MIRPVKMPKRPEWPTVALIAGCYLAWGLASTVFAGFWLPLAFVVLVLATAMHSSLQHEVLHGHPFPNQRLNEALVFPSLGLLIPYNRFRDLHLAHHIDVNLTDPYDDPESNYLTAADWGRQCAIRRAVLRFNNTLLGRLIIGVPLGQFYFMRADIAAIRAQQPGVLSAWGLHGLGLIPVFLWISTVSPMPLWLFLLGAYSGNALIKIRTFLEHQAHDLPRGRTAIVEDRGPLAFLFLNNNFHVVHHMHPQLPWYSLPRLYANNRDRFLKYNHGYIYRSYGQIMRLHMFRSKDAVQHPLMRK